MGWFEILALLKRVLPLLSRIAPMLETYIAARGATRGDGEALDRLSIDVQQHLGTAAQTHADVKDLLDAQNANLLHLSNDLAGLRAANAEVSERLGQIARETAANTRLLRVLAILTCVLLFACIGLLVVLLRRH